MKHRIRLATSDDAETIRRLVTDAGWTITGIDWTLVAPFWLVGEIAGKVRGCVQLALSRPIGYMEMMAVDNSLDGFPRHALIHDLMMAGYAQHARNGAQMVGATIPFELKHYKKVLKKRGGQVVARGNLMMKRLPVIQ